MSTFSHGNALPATEEAGSADGEARFSQICMVKCSMVLLYLYWYDWLAGGLRCRVCQICLTSMAPSKTLQGKNYFWIPTSIDWALPARQVMDPSGLPVPSVPHKLPSEILYQGVIDDPSSPSVQRAQTQARTTWFWVPRRRSFVVSDDAVLLGPCTVYDTTIWTQPACVPFGLTRGSGTRTASTQTPQRAKNCQSHQNPGLQFVQLCSYAGSKA